MLAAEQLLGHDRGQPAQHVAAAVDHDRLQGNSVGSMSVRSTPCEPRNLAQAPHHGRSAIVGGTGWPTAAGCHEHLRHMHKVSRQPAGLQRTPEARAWPPQAPQTRLRHVCKLVLNSSRPKRAWTRVKGPDSRIATHAPLSPVRQFATHRLELHYSVP